MKTIPILSTSFLIVLAMINNGCAPIMSATSITAAKLPWSSDDDKIQTPTKVTSIWTHTVLNQMGKRGVRGFGGRLMFYSKNQKESIKVEGTLTVYAFDEANKHHKTTNPDRKFVFLADKLETHYSKSNIGHSYSIWIPWDEVGGDQKQISLITRFEPKDGTSIMSENMKKLLPGVIKENNPDKSLASNSNKSKTSQKNKIELLSYEEGTKQEKGQNNQKETFTLTVPDDFVNKDLEVIQPNDSITKKLHLQKATEENKKNNSADQTSEQAGQSTRSSQTEPPAQKKQYKRRFGSHARSKRNRGWSPDPRPFLSGHSQNPKPIDEQTPTDNSSKTNLN